VAEYVLYKILYSSSICTVFQLLQVIQKIEKSKPTPAKAQSGSEKFRSHTLGLGKLYISVKFHILNTLALAEKKITAASGKYHPIISSFLEINSKT